ncbi:ABC transporter ATP-binding protein [Lichenicola sp.]|uniref:ABC transporter ATP-binding protein n=1 Tax=Lichenicola sp. TaxID=2804529 RepID=UPI003AFF8CAF
MSALLEVEALSVHLRQDGREAAILDRVGFSLQAGSALGIVGESGCGKSVLALSLIGLLPPAMRASGAIRLDGIDLLTLTEPALCRVRGRRVSMVFQEPTRALNPTQPIGRQVAEGMRLHLRLGRAEAEARAGRLLDRVGLPGAVVSPHSLPHRLSGGQRQRVMIAVALACDPSLLIADELSTALDMTTQAQILELLAELVAERRMGLLLITHDLGLLAQVCSHALVLYAGHTVETATIPALLAARAHPYTEGLFASGLHVGTVTPGSVLPTIPGQVPPPFSRGDGCCFASRCPRMQPDCLPAQPPLVVIGDTASAEPHRVACLHPLIAA